MKLPNAEKAYVDERKLSQYALDPSHPRGRHKARLFRAALGFGPDDSVALSTLVKELALTDDVAAVTETNNGIKYLLRHQLEGTSPRLALRHVWIILNDEDFPRLLTCFPERVK